MKELTQLEKVHIWATNKNTQNLKLAASARHKREQRTGKIQALEGKAKEGGLDLKGHSACIRVRTI